MPHPSTRALKTTTRDCINPIGRLTDAYDIDPDDNHILNSSHPNALTAPPSSLRFSTSNDVTANDQGERLLYELPGGDVIMVEIDYSRPHAVEYRAGHYHSVTGATPYRTSNRAR